MEVGSIFRKIIGEHIGHLDVTMHLLNHLVDLVTSFHKKNRKRGKMRLWLTLVPRIKKKIVVL